MALVQREASECEDGRRRREKKNNHYPKTCSVMSETLFSPARSPGALLRKYSGFVIEMWMADREDVTDLSKTAGVREKFWHLWERSHASWAYRPGTLVTTPGSLYLQARAQLWTEPVNTILCCPLLTSRLNQCKSLEKIVHFSQCKTTAYFCQYWVEL